VLVAEDAAEAGEGVFVQIAGGLLVAQGPQVGGEVTGRGQRLA
jgi:hypothetical protein